MRWACFLAIRGLQIGFRVYGGIRQLTCHGLRHLSLSNVEPE